MKNPFPDTLAFRAMALLVVGLAVTHFVSNLFYTTDRETTLLSAGGEHAIQWVATMGIFADTVSQEDWGDIVARAKSENRFVQISDAPFATASAISGWHEETLQKELARHVNTAEISNYTIAYVANNAELREPAELVRYFANEDTAAPEGFILVSLNIGGGKWLNLGSVVLPSPPFLTARLGLSMMVMLIAVLAISAVIVRRMTDPLTQLSRAAEKLGTDVQTPAIAETGPEEVRRTARAFNVMQRRIRSFVEDRTQMLGAIAHDLGTPITRLRLRAEFVEDTELRAKMLRDLDDMQQMVASTLAFIREDATSEPRAKVDIGSLLARVCDDIEDTGAHVSLAGIPRWLLVDCRPVALRRAISNVVDNAVKYGGAANVCTQLSGSSIKILIEDSGPGIDDARLEDVFRPFLRLEESRNRETGGTGLGLSVARTIIRAHGGDIRLYNRADTGLCAEIRLPLLSTENPEETGGKYTRPIKKTGPPAHLSNEGMTKWKTL